jgi:hypothetical protein
VNAADSRALHPAVDTAQQAAFLDAIQQNPINCAILERMPSLGLDDLWLVAGCLFQTVWNGKHGRAPVADIRDYDLFYFDDRDLSWEAEDRAIRRSAALFADLGVTVELRNQARVHLWYERRFGHPCPRLVSSRHGIERFLVAGTCVGVRRDDGHGSLELHAPYGLDDVFDGVLRPNPEVDAPMLFRRKAESYRRRWPWLVVADGPPDASAGS